jgi:uncharacterized integral membrane protein
MRWVKLVLLLLVALVATAFTLQNLTWTAPLQLNLGVVAWRLSQPAPVPALMWLSFGIGLLGATVVFGGRAWRLSSRVKQLEQEMTLASTRKNEKDPWAAG